MEAVKAKNMKTVNSSLQQFLAFGSLVVLIIFFSIASPNFMQWSNLIGI